MIDKLKDFIENQLPDLLEKPEVWNTLDVDYIPPRVERLWTQVGDLRFYLHVIHKPVDNSLCLFHKHRWKSAIVILNGTYEMGVAYNEFEVADNEDAHNSIPIATKLILPAGSWYEMNESHGLHYVRPLTNTTHSIMVSGTLYPVDRKELLNKKLEPLSDKRKTEMLREFKTLTGNSLSKKQKNNLENFVLLTCSITLLVLFYTAYELISFVIK